MKAALLWRRSMASADRGTGDLLTLTGRLALLCLEDFAGFGRVANLG
jgi:hypothetical protein